MNGAQLGRAKTPFKPNTRGSRMSYYYSEGGKVNMTKNLYAVTAQFDTPVKRRVESWIGQARNMRMAMRAATSAIMTRRGIKRFRHQHVTFFIEKIKTTENAEK